MSKTIHKQAIELGQFQRFDIASKPKVLSVQIQGTQPCIWYEVRPNSKEFGTLDVWVYGTGWDLPDNELDNKEFTGTIQVGMFVFHVYTRAS